MDKFKNGDIVVIKSLGLGAEVTDASRPDGLVEVRIAVISVTAGHVKTDVRKQTFPSDVLEIIDKKSGTIIL